MGAVEDRRATQLRQGPAVGLLSERATPWGPRSGSRPTKPAGEQRG